MLQVEAGRRVSVRFVNGSHSENALIDGNARVPLLQRVIDVDSRHVAAGPMGLLMTDRLAAKLGLSPGDTVRVEVREGRRQVLDVVVESWPRMGMDAALPAALTAAPGSQDAGMLRWCATVWPANRDGWFAAGALALARNLDWDSAQWENQCVRGYHPFARIFASQPQRQ